MEPYIIRLDKLGMGDVESVGGKNASLGEMISNLAGLGVTVPGGFATTAAAYRDFVGQEGLDAKIHEALETLDVDDVDQLARTGHQIRSWIRETPLQKQLQDDVERAWTEMSAGREISVAVRSSATAEDLPEASFAGQQETYLNVRGLKQVIIAVHEVFASLFN
ncbi:MAG: phosphoenolpyruvate synthase, partial [Chromatiales bacterium]|nr:phosphoenolpyruvate synthase [Chromatiales bacterium]